MVIKGVCYPVFWSRKKNPLLLLRFLRNLRLSRGPSWPVFFSKSRILLNFLLDSCYFWDIFYLVFLARKILVTFAIIEGYSGPFLAFSLSQSRRKRLNWLFLLFLWYLQVIASQNFLVNHFFSENCKKNSLANFCSQDRSFMDISQLLWNFTIILELNCLTFFKKDAGSL